MAKIRFFTRYTYTEPDYESVPGDYVTDDSQYISDAELITGLLTGVRQSPPARTLYYGLKYDDSQKKYVGVDEPMPVYSKDIADVPGDGEMASLEDAVNDNIRKLNNLERDLDEAKKQKVKKSRLDELQAQIDELKNKPTQAGGSKPPAPDTEPPGDGK